MELGELANTWRGFKYWSEDQEPRARVKDCHCLKFDEAHCGCGYKNPLLEEYVDCLHFILSIGLDIQVRIPKEVISRVEEDTITQFIDTITQASISYAETQWEWLLSLFLGLGEQLGFTWEEVEQAYFQKNKINHERQENGY